MLYPMQKDSKHILVFSHSGAAPQSSPIIQPFNADLQRLEEIGGF